MKTLDKGNKSDKHNVEQKSKKKEFIQYHSMYINFKKKKILFRDASIGNRTMKKSKNELTIRTRIAVTSGGREKIEIDKIDTMNF